MSTSSFGSAFSTGSAGSGGSSDSLSYGQYQSLNGQQRLQAARNAGALVTLSYELAPSGGDISSLNVMLPRLPQPFQLDQISLSVYDFYHDPSDWISLSCNLSIPATAETIVADSGSLSEGTIIMPLLAPLIPARQMLNCEINFSNSNLYGSHAYGLVLWIRGVWTE